MEAFLKNFDLVPFDILMIVVSAFLFVALWKILENGVFRPYLHFLELREAATEGAHSQAQEQSRRADELMAQYESKLTEARVAAMARKLTALAEAKAQAAAIIEAADRNAQEQVRAVRWELAQKMDALRKDALRDVETMADMVVQRVSTPAHEQRGFLH